MFYARAESICALGALFAPASHPLLALTHFVGATNEAVVGKRASFLPSCRCCLFFVIANLDHVRPSFICANLVLEKGHNVLEIL